MQDKSIGWILLLSGFLSDYIFKPNLGKISVSSFMIYLLLVVGQLSPGNMCCSKTWVEFVLPSETAIMFWVFWVLLLGDD